MDDILVQALLREGNRPFLSREGEICKLIAISPDQLRFRTEGGDAAVSEAQNFSWLDHDERSEIPKKDVGLLEALYNAYGLTTDGAVLEAVLAYEFDADPLATF